MVDDIAQEERDRFVDGGESIWEKEKVVYRKENGQSLDS